MITVKADGMEWPLATFISSHRYQPINEPPHFADSDLIILGVMRDGQLFEGIAHHAPWHDLAAIKARDFDGEIGECAWCNALAAIDDLMIGALDEWVCDDCMDNAEYE
jgi:hypothetical protein